MTEAIKNSFKPGDVVRLKSGGPMMTVASVGDHLGTLSVFCGWFVGIKSESDAFAVEMVERVELATLGQPSSKSWTESRRG